MDPPYVTRHNNNGFVDYNERLFSWDDQVRAAEAANEAADAGAHVIVTNAYHDEVLDLYDGFQLQALNRHSTLASTATARGPVREAILWKPGTSAA
jgi:DNA adenine methylase